MNAISFTLMLIAMLAVLITLGLGLFCMARGGDFNKKYSNKIMQARIYSQGAAIVFFALAVMASDK